MTRWFRELKFMFKDIPNVGLTQSLCYGHTVGTAASEGLDEAHTFMHRWGLLLRFHDTYNKFLVSCVVEAYERIANDKISYVNQGERQAEMDSSRAIWSQICHDTVHREHRLPRAKLQC